MAGVERRSPKNLYHKMSAEELSKEIRKENLSAWKAYLRWHLVHANARFLSSRVCERGLQFLGDAWRH